jgi:AraC family transcriptional regulator
MGNPLPVASPTRTHYSDQSVVTQRRVLRLLATEEPSLAGSQAHRHVKEDRPELTLYLDVAGSDSRRLRFRGGLAGGVLRRVRAYIDAHLGERISLKDLARQAGVSRFHFARQFRLTTGVSPMAYLRRVRIEHSLRMLLSGDSTIAEVAARLGFADQSHFTRIFARMVGMSPKHFVVCAPLRGKAGGLGEQILARRDARRSLPSGFSTWC